MDLRESSCANPVIFPHPHKTVVEFKILFIVIFFSHFAPESGLVVGTASGGGYQNTH